MIGPRDEMMSRCVRPRPPRIGDEREQLTAFLDHHRATVRCKLAGLPDDILRQPHQPSGMSPLGIVKHLGAVEMSWFQLDFAGVDPATIPHAYDWPWFWRISPDETAADVLAYYDAQVERSRAITAAARLDDIARNPDLGADAPNLRWVILHLIRETARHTGHLDLIREAIDGEVGE